MKSLKEATFTFLFLISIFTNSCAPSQQKFDPEAEAGKFHIVQKPFPGGAIDGYSLYIPESYAENGEKRAVLIFLHGGLGVGGVVAKVNQQPLPELIVKAAGGSAEKDAYLRDSFLVVSPHLSFGNYAERQFYQQEGTMRQIIGEVLSNYNADPSRVYLTGLSRGGHGTWGLASRMSDVLAAAVPIAGALHGVKDYQELTDLPMWVIHNTGDEQVDYGRTARGVEEIEALSGKQFLKLTSMELKETSDLEQDQIFTSFQREGHDSWTDAYESPILYKWLLRKRKIY